MTLRVLLPSGGTASIALLRSIVREYEFATGSCRDCGYNLTGNVSGVCPECGEAISDMSGTPCSS